MKKIILILSLAFASFQGNAQTAEDSIKVTIGHLFEGMLQSDTALLRSAFADSAILQSIGRDKSGNTTINTETVADFAAAIIKLPKGSADERIVYDVIRVDGPLAIVWASYEFYFNGKFSHCGVDSFQLVRINGQWKIQYLIDTRRRTGCKK